MRELTLVSTAYLKNQLMELSEPHIAMAGRSNVGKSTLINCMAGRKKLAKISSTPGKTRSINYYLAEPGHYYLVDLPGYGYAKTSKSERQKWAELVDAYLAGPRPPAAVAALLDCRLEPQRLDLELTSYLINLSIPIIPVLTKADKCKQQIRAKRMSQWREILRMPAPPLLFSGKTGMGREKLWRALDQAVGVQVLED